MNWIHWIPAIISIACAVISTANAISTVLEVNELKACIRTETRPSRESAEHSSSCGSTPPSLSRSEIHESYDCATCGTTATQSRNHREAAAQHSRR